MNMEHLLAATNKVVELNNQLTAVTEQRDAASAEFYRYHGLWDRATKQLETVMYQRDRLAEALQKLADCDWVITPRDRMDGVRAIAREALAAVKGWSDES